MEWKAFLYDGVAFMANAADRDTVEDLVELTDVIIEGEDLHDALRAHLLLDVSTTELW